MGVPTIPENLLSKQPIGLVLESLGFTRNEYGCLGRQWGNIRLSAGPWIGCWIVSGFWVTQRAVGLPEFRVPDEVVPAALIAALYHVWREANPSADVPRELVWGQALLDRRHHELSLIPPTPTLWADREFFRFCLSYIEQMQDWSEDDYEIRFAQAPGQLQIKARETEVSCPARGQWRAQAVVGARDFFRRMPKRFVGDTVCLQEAEGRLRVDSHLIKASWKRADTAKGETDGSGKAG